MLKPTTEIGSHYPDWQGNSSLNESSSANGDNGIESLIGKVIILTITAILTLLTIAGNLLVIIAFKINKRLQNLSNYCLVSLAVSDLAVGVFLMPVYTLYILLGHWPLGHILCDIWLSLDYALTTASVANVLVIALDRYMSVTRPLAYRAKRTSRKMGCMIASAWLISIFIWPPWIFAWPYIEGERTVPKEECYVQFLKSNPLTTTLTSVVSFYIPVTVTAVLYILLYRRAEQRKERRKAFITSFVSTRNKQDNTFHTRNEYGYTFGECCKTHCLCCTRIMMEHKLEDKDREGNDYHANPNCPVNDDSKHDSHKNNSVNSRKTAQRDRNYHLKASETWLNVNKLPNSNIQRHSQSCPCDLVSVNKNTINDHTSKRLAKPTRSMGNAASAFPDLIADLAETPSGSLNSHIRGQVLKARHGGRHHDRKIAKVLSAILVALVVSFAPYYTFAMVEVYCNDCISPVLHAVGK